MRVRRRGSGAGGVAEGMALSFGEGRMETRYVRERILGSGKVGGRVGAAMLEVRMEVGDGR